jgi:uncharacterized protein (DUF2126 family)
MRPNFLRIAANIPQEIMDATKLASSLPNRCISFRRHGCRWQPEPLPRYALGACWRKDGVPVWKNDSLIADESKDYGHGPKEAKELATRLAKTIGADPKFYEDTFYYTWKERRFPTNVTPEKSNLKDKQEREHIARIFQKGLGEVVGYALPIKRAWHGDQQG